MFKELLEKIVQEMPSIQACFLMDKDAMPLAKVLLDGDSEALEMIAAEFATQVWVLNKNKALREDAGKFQEMILRTERLTVLCRLIAREYLLLLMVGLDQDADQNMATLRLLSPN